MCQASLTRVNAAMFLADFQAHDKEKHRQALRLAKATRNTLYLENQLAIQRMREAEIVLSILRSEVQHTDHNVEEADVQVGMARAYLKSRTTYESEDDEVPPLLRNCDSDSAGSYTDSGSDHVTARSFLDTDFSSPGSHRLSEAALQQLDALSK
ncbi:hypothetical protein HYPSUDRAFT_57030 [Hypholoma sublateritium FD-334 SS-4]|uniref:Uncharacterized protein n=1 Tax=Hypholoma sublateritium (strain FD-334 SS-4) TaxID=945553 RepID=A0A0D2PEW8_HYPSF|nr:hypothetical protein HYPSUDRAFT_57030 [Hypholoma sublateritium FD-334 SS-4]